jgi:hypothetical protein
VTVLSILAFLAFVGLCAWRCGVASRKVSRALAEELPEAGDHQ